MQLKIKVTKDILRQAMWCGVNKSGKEMMDTKNYIGNACALALSVRDIAPEAYVYTDRIGWLGVDDRLSTELPLSAQNFIAKFDADKDPYKRLKLPEIEFLIDFPDVLVERIGIGEVERVLMESKTLERV